MTAANPQNRTAGSAIGRAHVGRQPAATPRACPRNAAVTQNTLASGGGRLRSATRTSPRSSLSASVVVKLMMRPQFSFEPTLALVSSAKATSSVCSQRGVGAVSCGRNEGDRPDEEDEGPRGEVGGTRPRQLLSSCLGGYPHRCDAGAWRGSVREAQAPHSTLGAGVTLGMGAPARAARRRSAAARAPCRLNPHTPPLPSPGRALDRLGALQEPPRSRLHSGTPVETAARHRPAAAAARRAPRARLRNPPRTRAPMPRQRRGGRGDRAPWVARGLQARHSPHMTKRLGWFDTAAGFVP